MNMRRMLLVTIIGGALAAPAVAQPVGPGPIGPGPMGLGPAGPGPGPGVPSRAMSLFPGSPLAFDADDRADELYNDGREAIEEGRYDRALDRFNRLIDLKSPRTDA